MRTKDALWPLHRELKKKQRLLPGSFAFSPNCGDIHTAILELSNSQAEKCEITFYNLFLSYSYSALYIYSGIVQMRETEKKKMKEGERMHFSFVQARGVCSVSEKSRKK